MTADMVKYSKLVLPKTSAARTGVQKCRLRGIRDSTELSLVNDVKADSEFVDLGGGVVLELISSKSFLGKKIEGEATSG